ncbi:unannotated protein [freshwater metagenome]|uniref:Unannotated protein n=1 Tax=freshwater metagenome TaxID=449393 RepID=A0A6J6V9Q1_9ZZZZ
MAPLAPGREEIVASGIFALLLSFLAAVIISAVLTAVPDGASILFAWCISIISALSKYLAAVWENCIIRTAPNPKFGAIKAPTFGCLLSRVFKCSIFLSSNPVVPTTTCMPLFIANSKFFITESGVVKSTIISVPVWINLSRASSISSAALKVKSVAALIAATASVPILPLAPSTATFMKLTFRIYF